MPERLAGGVLAGLGTLFFLRGIIQLGSALFGMAAFGRPDLGVQVADVLITSAWIVGGMPLCRRRAFRYIGGVGVLFQASMLFVGLLVFFILQPWLSGGRY